MTVGSFRQVKANREKKERTERARTERVSQCRSVSLYKGEQRRETEKAKEEDDDEEDDDDDDDDDEEDWTTVSSPLWRCLFCAQAAALRTGLADT